MFRYAAVVRREKKRNLEGKKWFSIILRSEESHNFYFEIEACFAGDSDNSKHILFRMTYPQRQRDEEALSGAKLVINRLLGSRL